MAAVKILTGPITAEHYAKEVPRPQWGDLVREWRRFCHVHLLHDCRELLRFVTEARTHRMWEALNLTDEEDFVRRGLELDPVEVEWALEGLKRRKPKEAVPFEQAITEGRSYTRKEAGALGGRGHKAVANGHSFVASATSSNAIQRIVRRLKRDAPDIAAALGRGEYRSARAAAIAAGIVKPPTALDQLRRAWRRATPDERQTFRQEIDG